jgi:small redox-active disulfide protein 2
MEIKVLGPGCSNCKKLYTETEKALRQLGLEAQLTKVEKIDEIVAHGAMMTPALVINGKVKVAGRIPTQTELTSWLATAAMEE